MSAKPVTVGVTRGSTMMNLQPFSFAFISLPNRLGSDHAGLSDQMRHDLELSVGLAPIVCAPNTSPVPMSAA